MNRSVTYKLLPVIRRTKIFKPFINGELIIVANNNTVIITITALNGSTIQRPLILFHRVCIHCMHTSSLFSTSNYKIPFLM